MSDDTPRDRDEHRLRPAGRRPTPEELAQARREALRLKMTRRPLGVSGRIGRAFLESKLTPLIIVVVAAARRLRHPGDAPRGGAADQGADDRRHGRLPRRHRRGGRAPASSRPLEKLLYEIENVEYIYSTSQPSGGLIVVRFLVGTDPDQAALRVHTKIASAADQMPDGRPAAGGQAAHHRRRAGGRLHPVGRGRHPDPAAHGGRRAQGRAHPPPAGRPGLGDRRPAPGGPGRLRPRAAGLVQRLHPAGLPGARRASTGGCPAGSTAVANTEILVDVGQFLRDRRRGRRRGGRRLRRPPGLPQGRGRRSCDGPEEPASYVWLGTRTGRAGEGARRAPGSTCRR